MTENHLEGKICFVTGSTSGIGKVTARELADRGATVVLVSRNRAKGEAIQAEIKQATGNQHVDLLVADLSLLEDVRRLATEFQQTYPHLHLLVNNAGCAYPRRTLTSEGLEATLAVNYLAPFLLTELLLDTLKASAPARIVNVSSAQHTNASIEFDNLQSEKKYANLRSYNQAKLALLLWTYELARRLEGTGVTVNALHPGITATNFPSGMTGAAAWVMRLSKPFLLTPEKGAQTTLYLATSPEVEGVTGKYFVKSQETKSSNGSYDQTVGSRLWEVTEQLVARSA
ncbi:MAG TPA: short-chain dehydrogenase [Ktedonobacter sp.]|jgi:NAD(P)-dependent dehydrogenase (short-subunit alcohol dehydrogenase family)|nr:short-chain dehydrogenase [Ktedonobacter sp.]